MRGEEEKEENTNMANVCTKVSYGAVEMMPESIDHKNRNVPHLVRVVREA